MYSLPLLPGYGPNTNIRSSASTNVPARQSIVSRFSEAEEDGYQGTYFTMPRSPKDGHLLEGGYVVSHSPVETRDVGEGKGGIGTSELEESSDARESLPLLNADTSTDIETGI